MNNSEKLAITLARLGIKDVFCITGGHALYLNQALASQPGLKMTYFHHEQAASMAADAYYRICKMPAVVNISAGPAALNTLNGVYGSYVDSVPVVYISGQPKTSQLVRSTGLPLRQYGDQEFDKIADLVAPICKQSIVLTTKDDIEAEVEKAFLVATSGRPGPVWIDIPMDIQSAEYLDRYALTDFHLTKHADCFTKLPVTGHVETIFSALKKSERPLIYAGPEVRNQACYATFWKLVNLLNIPVVTSWNAHDLIPTAHPLFAGRPGLRGERCGNWVTYSADCLLILGEHLTPRQIGYVGEDFSPNSYKIMVVTDIAEAAKPELTIDLIVHADLEATMQSLINAAGDVVSSTEDSWTSWAERCRTVVEDYFPAPTDYQRPKELLNPYHAIFDVFDNLRESDLVIAGNGVSVVGVPKFGQRLFQNTGCASMGYDLPASVGASIAAANGQRVICFTGDGSIQMNIQELQTISHLEHDVIIFVVNNGGYDSIRQSQESVFGQNCSKFGVSPDTGVTFPSFEKISAAYEFQYFRASSYSELQETILGALKCKKAICELVTVNSQNFEPKVATSVLDDGSLASGSLIDMTPRLDKEKISQVLDFLTCAASKQ